MSEKKFPAAVTALKEYTDIEEQMGQPDVVTDAAKMRKLGRRHAELAQIVEAYKSWEQACTDYQVANELAKEDSSFAQEAEDLGAKIPALEDKLYTALIPRDPDDKRARAARRLLCLPAICFACTCAMRKNAAGRLKS